ncbi:carboxypeptidase regulatory-like domain-containing protein [Paenibacillus sp. y28]|uniref:carboxypeptidase regulatory-like domain-containing protein n=1 Tax=Paenibacillus sp. y28 TaxID=3129110 RepID=UPI00301925C0
MVRRLQERGKKWTSLFMVTVFMLSMLSAWLPAGIASAGAGTGTTYYVDAASGNDNNAGTMEAAAWRTLDKVNATTFQPGDRILLRSGQSWTGQLWPKGSGSDGQPIIIDQYGSGAKPKIEGQGLVSDAVLLFNQEYWEIHNLDVSNAAPATATPGENLDDYRGIHIAGDNSQQLDYFRISGVDVHDVTGEIAWISGTPANPPEPGIRFKTGWDGSKNTGGIVFNTTVPDIHNPPDQATTINDVVIENSTVKNTSFAGIIFKQYTGDGKDADGNTIAVSTGWGTRNNASDPKFTPHTNIVIRNNYINQGNTEYGCNGMYLTNIRGAMVERNVVHQAGTSGIETYYADDITIQYNEVYETTKKAGGADSNGIDPDKGTTRMLIQYNYVHDNGDGILLCQFSFGDTVVRYNLIKSNTRYPIYLHSDSAATAEVYNNTIYNDKSNYLIYGYGSSLNAKYYIKNNNIYSTRANATITTSNTTFYENNNYYGTGLLIPAMDTKALTVDPKFVNPVAGASGTEQTGPQLDAVLGFQVQSGSQLINAGLTMPDNGAKDYAGQPLYNGQADIGAFEYYTSPGSTTESVNGKVLDGVGRPVSGAAVSVEVNGTSYPAASVTDATGLYVINGVPFADNATLTASKNGYIPGTAQISITGSNTTTQSLTVISNSPVGKISGQVMDEKAEALAGASIVVTNGAETLASAVSEADGSFIVPNVPIGDGYTVTVSHSGYHSAVKENLSVTPDNTTNAGKLLVANHVADYKFVHHFNDYATGAFSSTGGLTVSPSGGSIQIAPVPDAADKSMLITRSSNSGSTSVTQSFVKPLKGIITIEEDVMRNDTASTSSANWMSVPYIYGSGSSSAPGISAAFSKNKIRVYKGTTDTEVQGYNLNQWYHLRFVINTETQTFDLYVDGEQIYKNATFRRDMPDISSIMFYANSSNYGSVHVDNIKVIQGYAYDINDANLAGLAMDGGELQRLDDTHYTVNVSSETESVILTPTAFSPYAKSIMVSGNAAVSGQPAAPVELTEDQTDISIVVTAEDGVTVKTYTVTVNRLSMEVVSDLKGLAISSGSLEPVFASGQLDYTVSVPYEVERMTLTPTAVNPLADIRVQGKPVQSGYASASLDLAEGSNLLQIVVISQDGTANTTYTVTVHRGLSPFGRIAGTVKDGTGTPLFGANVNTVINGQTYSAASGAEGGYVLAGLPPGAGYTVTANKAGYDAGSAQGVNVVAGQTTDGIDLMLAANGPVAKLNGIDRAVPDAGFDSTFSLVNVSSSVYGAVYAQQLIVTFNPEVLEFTGAESLKPGWTLEKKEQQGEGQVLIKQQSDGPGFAVTGSSDLLKLLWKVKASPAAGQTVITAGPVELTNGWQESFQAAPAEHVLLIEVPNPEPETVDKTRLNSKITAVQATVEAAVEGSRKGQYPAGSKAVLAAAIAAAQQTADDESADQAAVDAAMQALDQALQAFRSLQITKDRSGASSGSTSAGSGGAAPAEPTEPAGTAEEAPELVLDAEGNITVTLPLAENGSAAVPVLTAELLAKALQQAEAGPQGVKQVKLVVPSNSSTAASALFIPAAAVMNAVNEYSIEIQTPLAAVILPSNMIQADRTIPADNIEIQIKPADLSQAAAEDRAYIGTRPAVDLEALAGGQSIGWSNPNAPVTVLIPYTPAAEELAESEHIVVWYVDKSGGIVPVPSGHYEAASGQVTFTANHFSRYAVAFVKKSFPDIQALEWAQKPIEVLASKGVVNGTSEAAFSPEQTVSRADFLVMLVRALQLEAASETDAFADVDTSDYYYNAVRTARALGITAGAGNNRFEPQLGITREDTMVLTARALQAAGRLKPSQNAQLESFEDAAEISDYAAQSVAALASSGIVGGYDGAIHPKVQLTRAQAAVMVYRMMNQ